MIFLSNAAGEITAAIPETINQGSIGVNKIVLIAPFPASSVVSATFTLPNGIKIYPRYVDGVREENYPYLMGVVEAFGDEGLVIDGVTVNAWQLTLDKAITQIAGKVTVQFLVTGSNGTLTTTSATLPINRGNAYISPSVDQSEFDTITQYLAAAENAAGAAEDARKAAEAAAEETKLNADRYSPWDVVATQEIVIAVLNGMAYRGLKSYLFLNVDFTKLNLNNFINGDGIPQINIADSIEKVEFRGCTFESAQGAPLALKFFYQGSQCSISGAKGDEIIIEGFADVIDCRAALIKDCECVTACDAVTLNDCESVTDTTAETFVDCIFVDPFTVIGFVPPEDVGKVATLTDDGAYKTERLAKTIRAAVNPNNFKIKIALDDVNGIEMSEAEIDLPLESVVVGANVSEDGTKLILTLQNGNTVDVPIADIFRGVATEGYVNDTVGQAIDNLKPYDVETEKVNLGYQQTYLKLTIDNLLDGNYESFQPFDMVCVGSDGYPLSSLCTVTVEQYDQVRMLVYDSKYQTTHLYPQYYLSEDGNVYLYFSTYAEYLQVFIRGLVEKCTGATLEIVDTLPGDVLDISIEKHITEDYVSYTANDVTQRRPIGHAANPYSIVCRNSAAGIDVRTPDAGRTYADTEAVNYKYLRDVMLPEALANISTEPYDVVTERVASPRLTGNHVFKLTIDNLNDGVVGGFHIFELACTGEDGTLGHTSTLCKVAIDGTNQGGHVDVASTLDFGIRWRLHPRYVSTDGKYALYFSTMVETVQVYIRGITERCTGATLEYMEALPDDVTEVKFQELLDASYVGYNIEDGTMFVNHKRPIGDTPEAYGIVCRNADKGIEVRSLGSGQTYADNEAVPFGYIRDTMLSNAGGGGGGNANIDVTAEVGQTIIVKEVDANGKPTKWESADYQERICWTDETVVLPEVTGEVSYNEDFGGNIAFLPSFTLTIGKQYVVTYNGTKYNCICAGTSDVAGLGNLGAMDESFNPTDEPFIIVSFNGEPCVAIPLDDSTSVTVSILKLEVVKIPQKYIDNDTKIAFVSLDDAKNMTCAAFTDLISDLDVLIVTDSSTDRVCTVPISMFINESYPLSGGDPIRTISNKGFAIDGDRVCSMVFSVNVDTPNNKIEFVESLLQFPVSKEGVSTFVPVTTGNKWEYESLDEILYDPGILTLRQELLVDGATIQVYESQLGDFGYKFYKTGSAYFQVYGDDSGVDGNILSMVPIIFAKINVETFESVVKCISPTTGDIITVTLTKK